MTVHEDEWRRMTLEERVASLRITVFAQEVLIKVLMQAVERLGVTFTTGDELDEDADES